VRTDSVVTGVSVGTRAVGARTQCMVRIRGTRTH
jgi:hypothetical protein